MYRRLDRNLARRSSLVIAKDKRIARTFAELESILLLVIHKNFAGFPWEPAMFWAWSSPFGSSHSASEAVWAS